MGHINGNKTRFITLMSVTLMKLLSRVPKVGDLDKKAF